MERTLKIQILKIKDVIESEDCADTAKQLRKRTLKEFKNFMLENDKNFDEINKHDVINLAKRLKSRSYSYLNIQIDSLNYILKHANREDLYLHVNGIHKSYNRENKEFDIKENIIDTSDRYYTREEIQGVCKKLINPVDKFIIYGLFCGINGKERAELLNLKKDQVNFENNTILLSDRIVYIDEYMGTVLKSTLDESCGKIYFKHLDDTVEGSTSDSFELNFKSPYVIKTKPYSKNNYGIQPMKLAGFNQRIKTLNIYLQDFKLVPRDIVRSGIIDRMYRIKKEGWTQGQVEEFLKQNNIRSQAFELKRIFEMKYNKK
ncbi:hypothetical protein C672_3470 [[Clostridium] bifermentans ATCC 638]|uniref:MrpR C-terminal catalytic domain-containing protein n=1 Tax=Paraclostridium bifermentans ATCC 638 = DSM 14991 TaxID=1233171 RepID=T4VF25_PARBF|nr:hypothetical protein [Paraclostridium bifermentans]EQK40103.1 hypothetical protein C672_3470 [[Clostridium] bifermentans ATCC 638] [Paraclostridium bifermentans ATCC 638 = DSM 14991]RIZ57339.1 hypothetical protein CHH45_16795 [Paraclostridium bifermentans]UAG20063.1 hypothetical protein KXZ80_17545 [Paraclostridium bifermentans]